MKKNELAGMIDHTLLKSTATSSQIDELCKEAMRYGFFSVCVNPTWVERCFYNLTGTNVRICTVIGFPLGQNTSGSKAEEARIAVGEGAGELDMVMKLGRFLEGEYESVLDDIRGVVEAAGGIATVGRAAAGGKPVKVIIEICYLTDEQIVLACQIAEKAGAKYVKTSTGFGTGGATVEAVELMRKTVGPMFGVKASGGIKTYEDAMKMIMAGATRIGASAGIEIIRGAEE